MKLNRPDSKTSKRSLLRQILLVFLLVYCSSILVSQVTYPDECYAIDSERDFRIALGSSISFFFNEYGRDLSQTILGKVQQPDYEIWQIDVSEDLSITYDTYDNIITMISFHSDRLCLSNGLSVGATVEDIYSVLGPPTSAVENESTQIIVFNSEIPEINHYGEYTSIQFTLEDGQTTRIVLAILSMA